MQDRNCVMRDEEGNGRVVVCGIGGRQAVEESRGDGDGSRGRIAMAGGDGGEDEMAVMLHRCWAWRRSLVWVSLSGMMSCVIET